MLEDNLLDDCLLHEMAEDLRFSCECTGPPRVVCARLAKAVHECFIGGMQGLGQTYLGRTLIVWVHLDLLEHRL